MKLMIERKKKRQKKKRGPEKARDQRGMRAQVCSLFSPFKCRPTHANCLMKVSDLIQALV